MEPKELFRIWKQQAADPELVEQLELMEHSEADIGDSFYRALAFGTAGLRGVMGPGTNRMNLYAVRRAALALGAVLGPGKSAVVGFDTRRNSERFAAETAAALASAGVKVRVFDEAEPLPLLSFAIRELKCDAGVMITASHNPAEFNGFKCFGPDGGQIAGEMADLISQVMENTPWFSGELEDFGSLLSSGKIELIEKSLYDKYLAAVLACTVDPVVVPKSGLRVLYTPLNGTGARQVPKALQMLGVSNLDVVRRQMEPDPNFTTCAYPNPEMPKAFEKAFAQAERTGPDIIIATDPDCDRIGLAVRDGAGYRLLTGNETGCLLLNYILGARFRKGTLPERPVAVRSIVSLPLADRIAERFGCEMRQVPVGFKYIGEQMTALSEKGEDARFIFAFEESCGYVAGMHCRDKDAVCAAVLICEMAAAYKLGGYGIINVLDGIGPEYGYYLSDADSITLTGEDGEKRRNQVMARIRARKPESVSGLPVLKITDYLAQTVWDMETGTVSPIDLPPLDVMAFSMSCAKLIVRPSGTEPKMKIYYMAAYDTKEGAQAIIDGMKMDFKAWTQQPDGQTA